MAEIAGVASVVGLVDVGFRASHGIWSYCRDVKDSTVDARKLHHEFSKLSYTLNQLEAAMDTSELNAEIVTRLRESIKMYRNSVDEVPGRIPQSLISSKGNMLRKPFDRLKYPYVKVGIQNEKEISMQLMSRLGIVLAMLNVYVFQAIVLVKGVH